MVKTLCSKFLMLHASGSLLESFFYCLSVVQLMIALVSE